MKALTKDRAGRYKRKPKPDYRKMLEFFKAEAAKHPINPGKFMRITI